MQRRSRSSVSAGVAVLLFGVSAPAFGQVYTSVIPGQKVGGSSNIHVVGHLNLDSAYKTADITIEQELSRPYVYVGHRLVPSGVQIISIKDPSKPVLLWKRLVPQAELHKGAGGLNPIYLKSKGRYYLTQAYQFQTGGPDTDLGAQVWDVTGLPDTNKIKLVAEIRDAENPGGFHESQSYKHSNGEALLFTQASGPCADVWDIDQVAAAGKGDPRTGLVGRVPIAATDTVQSPRGPRAPAYHDFYIAYDPATHQDKSYGAGAGGYYVYDVTDLKNPKLLTTITGIAGVQRGHT